MTGRIGTPCREPRCRAVVTDGEKFCPLHRQQQESTFRNRYGERLKVYDSAAWKKARAFMIAQCPICSKCGRAPSTVVHHKLRARVAQAAQFDFSNLEALCERCHNSESQRESREEQQRKKQETENV